MALIYGHLTLIGDKFELAYVTQVLGTVPMWHRKADEILGNGKKFGHCEWGVKTEQFDTNELSVVSNALMHAVPCAHGIMAEIAKETNSEWNILFTIDVDGLDELPCIMLEPSFIEFASEIGAVIGFDI